MLHARPRHRFTPTATAPIPGTRVHAHTHTHAGRRCQIYIASRAACFAIARRVQSTTLSALNQRTGAHVDAPSWVAGQSLRNPGRGGGGWQGKAQVIPAPSRTQYVGSPGGSMWILLVWPCWERRPQSLIYLVSAAGEQQPELPSTRERPVQAPN